MLKEIGLIWLPGYYTTVINVWLGTLEKEIK